MDSDRMNSDSPVIKATHRVQASYLSRSLLISPFCKMNDERTVTAPSVQGSLNICLKSKRVGEGVPFPHMQRVAKMEREVVWIVMDH